MTSKERRRAVADYARKHGLYVYVVRGHALYRKEAYKEFKHKQEVLIAMAKDRALP